MGLAPNGAILLEETGIGVRPSAGQVLLFADTTGNPQLKFVDDNNNQIQLVDTRNTATLSGKTFSAPNIGAATGSSLAVSGTITSSGGSVGYATGAGGTVVQSTSKVTAFTLSKFTGTITFAADSLAADTTSTGAVWTNTVLGATDVVYFNHISGGTLGAYTVCCTPAAGSATIYIHNNTPGALAESPVFQYAIIKGVTA